MAIEDIFKGRKEPYIIAEVGVNHEGDLNLAKKMIDSASENGADCVKFQTYKAESLVIKDSPAYWDLSKEKTKTQYQLFKKYDTFRKDDYENLANYCQQKNIDFASTPFDLESVDLLDPLVSFYKIASADLLNVPLLRAIAQKGKPILLSTGASTLKEISFALDTIAEKNKVPVCLLHCMLNYPTENKNANLNVISQLKLNFPSNLIGYSDHTVPDDEFLVLLSAFTLGASIIEKHYTYNKKLSGNDHYHAIDSSDLKSLRKKLNAIVEMIGDGDRSEIFNSEKISRLNARRSIVITQSIKRDEILTEKHLTCKRPGTGIGSEHWDEIIGKRVKMDLEPEHMISLEDIY